MKKKIFLILAMVTLCVCIFAISASATNYFPDDFVLTENDLFQQYEIKSTISMSNEDGSPFVSTLDFDIGIILCNLSSGSYYGLYNVEGWKVLIDEYNEYSIANPEDHLNFNEYIVDKGYWSSYDSWIDYFPFDELYNQYLEYIDAKYSGFISEYETSEEYKSAMNSKYTQGVTAGREQFKSSQEYLDILAEEYELGSKEGVSEYLLSDEYKTSLKTEYDKGMSEAETENTIFIALGVVFILIVFIFCFLLFSRFRKKSFKR